MPGKAWKLARVTKFLIAGATMWCLCGVSWIASVNEWHVVTRRGGTPRGVTMRTIVGYSEGKQAEMERPSPLACERLPAFPKVPLINRTWVPNALDQQWQPVRGTKVSLYAAYYDSRTPQKYVRILASFHGRNFSTEDTLFCQTRSTDPDEDFIEVVAAKTLEIWYHKWDATSIEVDTPMLLSCPLTDSLYSLSVVSIVTQPCDDPTNAFFIDPFIQNTPNRKFTICVKDMEFEQDISTNIIEWIETNRLLGVDTIDMYIDKLSEETVGVLQYYRDRGIVRLYSVPIKNKGDRSLWQRRRDHIITYNDCLYRNIMDTEFIIPLDVDEIILPKKTDNLVQLVQNLKNYGWDETVHSAMLIKNVFFFDFMQAVSKRINHMNLSKIYTKRDDVRIETQENVDISKIDYIDSINNEVIDDNEQHIVLDNKSYKLRCGIELPVPKIRKHFVRSALVSPVGSYTKSLMVTKKVLTAFNHYPLANVGAGGLSHWPAPFAEVQLNHYKESCNSTLVKECSRYKRRARVDTSAFHLYPRLASALANTPCTNRN